MHLNPHFILRKVADEALLISIQDISAPKRLLMLNELGANIYTLLQQGETVENIHSTLLAQYEVDPSTLKADIDEFMLTLTSYGVLID